MVLDNHKQVTPVGLNLAIEQSIGDILILIGGHTEIEPDYVRNCVRHLEENKAEVVGGPIETIGETLQARSIAASLGSTFGVGGNAFRTVSDRELFVDTVAFGAAQRKVLDRLGMFDEELVRNHDDEYNYRIREHGGKILLTLGHPLAILQPQHDVNTLAAVSEIRLLQSARFYSFTLYRCRCGSLFR